MDKADTLYFISVGTVNPRWEPSKHVKGQRGAIGQISMTGKYEEYQRTCASVKASCVLIGPSLVVST